MKKLLFLFAFSVMAIAASAQKSTKLYNGKNLDNWGLVTKNSEDIASKEFKANKGVIDISGKFGYMYTLEQYSNYKLTLEWRWVGEGSNSGVFLNLQGEKKVWPACFEVQLSSGSAGGIIHSGGTTSDEFYKNNKKPFLKGYKEGLEKELGKWNKLEVVCTPNQIQTYVNGTKQCEINNLSQKKGNIALQGEGKAIQFRKVVVTPLK
ncbi:MAG: DUF1080 domain-containing protein [Rikenellaceae bacterium]